MKKIVIIQTYDGLTHTSKNNALKHLDATQKRIISSLSATLTGVIFDLINEINIDSSIDDLVYDFLASNKD